MKSKKPVILVVDDSPTNLALISDYLKEEFQIKIANSGHRALNLVKNSLPDLILLDIMMPGMDGYQVCKILKADEQTKKIPVIFATALNQTENEQAGLELGAVDYVTKPFCMPILRQRIKTQIALKQASEILEKRNQEFRELLHTLCHDLVNPFFAIESWSSMFETLAEEKKKRAIEHINQAAQNGLNLIEVIRTLRSVEEKGATIQLHEQNLLSALQESLQQLENKFLQKNIRHRIDIPENFIILCEKTSLVHSVLNNLITNAIKFSWPGNSIEIFSHRKEEKIILTIQDHGIGMNQKLLEDIFDVSKKTSRPGTEKEKGTGFGMPLVKKFMTLYGGDIQISSLTREESESDHGTRVTLEFLTKKN